MISIIILTKERPLQLAHMLKSIEDNTNSYRVILCDNGSVDPDMQALLMELKSRYTVIYNGPQKKNMHFTGFNAGLKLVKDEFFFLSDPDIIIKDGTPRNWPEVLVGIMQTANSPKVGFGLDISFDPVVPGLQELKDKCAKLWENEITISGQRCTVFGADTTMAAYRKDSLACWLDGDVSFRVGHGLNEKGDNLNQFNPKYTGKSLMVKEPFVAYHAPWTFFKQYDAEQIRYLKLSDKWATSTYYSLNNYYQGKV